MSTIPTESLEITYQTVTATQPVSTPDPTAVTEAALDIESIKQIMDGFDPAVLLPELEQVFAFVTTACRVAVAAAPVVLLVLGLAYLFFSPKEANYLFGYRCYYGMGSVEAWRFTQRLAGLVLGGLGLVLTGIMLFIGGGFGALAVEVMVWRALKCLIWEAAAIIAAIAAINITVSLRFDARGELRKK